VFYSKGEFWPTPFKKHSRSLSDNKEQYVTKGLKWTCDAPCLLFSGSFWRSSWNTSFPRDPLSWSADSVSVGRIVRNFLNCFVHSLAVITRSFELDYIGKMLKWFSVLTSPEPCFESGLIYCVCMAYKSTFKDIQHYTHLAMFVRISLWKYIFVLINFPNFRNQLAWQTIKPLVFSSTFRASSAKSFCNLNVLSCLSFKIFTWYEGHLFHLCVAFFDLLEFSAFFIMILRMSEINMWTICDFGLLNSSLWHHSGHCSSIFNF